MGFREVADVAGEAAAVVDAPHAVTVPADIGLGDQRKIKALIGQRAFGARDVGRNLIRAAQMMGASQRDLVVRVVLPNALPSIFTGMRIGLGVAWTAVIVAEIVAVKSGLGYVLWDAYYVGRMDVVLADMVSIGLAGFLSDRLMLLIAHRVLHWQALSR